MYVVTKMSDGKYWSGANWTILEYARRYDDVRMLPFALQKGEESCGMLGYLDPNDISTYTYKTFQGDIIATVVEVE